MARKSSVRRDDVIAIPTDAAADVQQYFVEPHQDGRDLVGNRFRRVEMPGVEAEQLLAADGVAQVKLVRAHDIRFRAESEQLRLDGIAVEARVNLLGEHLVERPLQPFARRRAVGRRVLVAVRNPDVGDARRAQLAAEGGADFTAGHAVLDPKAANAGVGMGQREAIGGLGMSEVGRIEVQSQLPLLRPADPAAEVLRCEGIPLDAPAARLGITGVQAEAMGAGYERQRLLEIGAQLVGRAGFAGKVARDSQAAAQPAPAFSKAAHVVALPAMQRQRQPRQLLQRPVGIDAEPGIVLPREGVGRARSAIPCSPCGNSLVRQEPCGGFA